MSDALCSRRFAPLIIWMVLTTGCVGVAHNKDLAVGQGVQALKPRLPSVREHVTTRSEFQKLVGHFQTDASYGRFFWARWQQVKLQIDSVGISGLGSDRFWKIVNVLAIFDEDDRVAEYQVCSERDLIECLRRMVEVIPEPPANVWEPLVLDTTTWRSTTSEAYGRVVIADARVYVEELEGKRFSVPVAAMAGVSLHQYSGPEDLELKLHFRQPAGAMGTGAIAATPAQTLRLMWLLSQKNSTAHRPEEARDVAVGNSIVSKKPRLTGFQEGVASREELEKEAGQFKTKASYGPFFWARWQEPDDPESDRYWRIMNVLAVFDDRDKAARYRVCSDRELPECLRAFAQDVPPPSVTDQRLVLTAGDGNLARWTPWARWKNQEFVGDITLENGFFTLRNVLGHTDRVPAAAMDLVMSHDTYCTPEVLRWELHFSHGVEQQQTAPIGFTPEQAWRFVWLMQSAKERSHNHDGFVPTRLTFGAGSRSHQAYFGAACFDSAARAPARTPLIE
jgi:hypothetical protein